MLNRLNGINRDLLFIVSGRIFQIFLMLISVRITTTLLSPKEMGNYNLLLTILSFFNLVFLNPPSMYFSRHIISWNNNKNLLNGLFVFFIWIIFVSLIGIILSVLIYNYFDYKNKFDLYLFLTYMTLSIIFSTVHRNILYGLNMLGERKKFVIFLLTTLSLRLLLSFLIVYFIYNHSIGWAFGTLLSEIIVLYFIYKLFVRDNKLNINKIKLSITKNKIKETLIFCIPIAITVFLMWGQNTAYKIVVDYKYSAEILGYMAVGFGVSGAVFGSIESISMQYFNPIFYKNILNANKEERAKAWNDIAKYMVVIYILALIFTISISEYLVSILVDKKFYNSYIYTMIGAGIEFFRVMTNLLNNVSQSEKNTKVTVLPYFIGFLISLGIISIFNFKENYYMIAFILLFAYLSVYILMYFQVKNLLNIKYNLRLIFKSILFGSPLFIILFLNIQNNILNSIYILFISGSYFLYSGWFLIRKIGSLN